MTPIAAAATPPHRPHATADDAPAITPFDYVDFFARYNHACGGHDAGERAAMAAEINGLLGRLRVEEGALQLLVYRLAHMHLEPGLRVRLAVDRDLLNRPVSRYAPEYELTEVWAARRKGGPAALLQPVGGDPRHATLVVCRGTLALGQSDVMARPTWPVGLRDDVHPRGVGHVSCAWLAPQFIALAQRLRGQDRELVLVGHSLGAAVATGLLARLPADARDHVHLFSFKPPGVPPRIAHALLPDAARVRVIEHRLDWVGKFGRCKPAGTRIKLRGRAGVPLRVQVPHAVPQIAIWELTGTVCHIVIKIDRHVRYGSLPLEGMRVGAGVAAGWALPL